MATCYAVKARKGHQFVNARVHLNMVHKLDVNVQQAKSYYCNLLSAGSAILVGVQCDVIH